MMTTVLMLLINQFAGDGSARGLREPPEKVVERASKEADLERAGLILSSLLIDEANIRSALAATTALDDRSAYVLLGGNWGSLAKVSREQRARWSETLVRSISARPNLIKTVIRVERFEAYITVTFGRGSESGVPFFSTSRYVDDVAEYFMERLRKETGRPPSAILFSNHVILTEGEHEVELLANWQMLCGICDRLDLIEESTTKNWRDRFPELDKWFKANRPFVSWDEGKSCMTIDDDAKEWGSVTARSAREIPDLKPPWLKAKAGEQPGGEQPGGHS